MTPDPTGRRPTRRQCLRTGSALFVAGLLAGCPSESDEPQTTTPIGTPQPNPETPPPDVGPDADIPYDVSVSHDISSWSGYDPDWEAPDDAPPTDGYRAETLVENLEIPWDLSFAPTGELFLTERTGRLLVFESGDTEPVAEPGDVVDAAAIEPGSDEDSWYVEGGEGGLLGVAVHPAYPDPPLVYTYFTAETGSGRENRVVAFDASADDPAGASWPIVEGIPADAYHNGGRIAFGPEGYLWIATGDGDPALDDPATIRDPGTLGGKILRVEPDGSAPAANPHIAADADPRVFTYGHRNPQGITWLPDGTPVITEHGPTNGDEVNVLRPGADYGWPDVRNDDAHTPYDQAAARPPVAESADWAPAGAVFYTGESVSGLANRILFGCLIGQQVVALTVTPGNAPPDGHDVRHGASWMDDDYGGASSAILEDELGRVRHVEQGPDGALYAATSNRDGRAQGGFPTGRDDRLVRLSRGDA